MQTASINELKKHINDIINHRTQQFLCPLHNVNGALIARIIIVTGT
jgi:hypothetical protein